MNDTSSEQNRHLCELGYLRKLSPAAREMYIREVAEKRGQACADKLREDLKK